MAKRKIIINSPFVAAQERSKTVDMQEREQAGIAAVSQQMSINESNANDEDIRRDSCEAGASYTHLTTLSSSLSSCQEFKPIENKKASDRDDKDHIEEGCSYAIEMNAMVSQFPIESDDSPIQPLSPTVVTQAQVHEKQEDCEEDGQCSDSYAYKTDQQFNEMNKPDLALNQPLPPYEVKTCTPAFLLQENSPSDILPSSRKVNSYTPASPLTNENSREFETCMPAFPIQESSTFDILLSSPKINSYTPASPITNENSREFETCKLASPLQQNCQADILPRNYLTSNAAANSDGYKNYHEHRLHNQTLPLQESCQPVISPSSLLMHNNMLISSDINMNDEKFASPVISQYTHIVRPKTPDMLISPDDIFSPDTKASIKETIRALYPDLVPQPVIPVKKRKKGDVPYIVGCTTRQRVPEKPSLRVFKGDKYGITSETNSLDNDECAPRKRSRVRKNQYENWSKSRFNPKSDEIAARLKLNEKVDELLRKSPANETTLFMSKPYCSRPQAFSPLPSTSKDNETIMKNEKHFNESLNYNNNQYDERSTVKNDRNYFDYDNNNYDIGDDEELPEVILDLSDTKKSPKKKYNSLLQRKDFDFLNKGVPVFNEDMNNNNNDDDVYEEYDFTKIKIKKYTPETVVKGSHSLIDDNSNVVLDLNPAINKSPEIIDTIEINDEYGSHLANKTTNVMDVETNSPFKNTSSVSIIEIPDVIEPNLSNKSSTIKPNAKYIWNEDIEFVSETPLNVELNSGTRNELSVHNNENITAGSSNNDIGTVVNNFFSGKNKNNDTNKELEFHSAMPNDIKMLFSVLTESCSRYLQPKRRKRCAMSNIKKLTSNKVHVPKQTTVVQPEETTVVNNENAAPSANALFSTANGERRLGDCPICMESLSNNFIASTTCGHVFCLDCIKTCLRTSGKRCPTCRKQLKGTGYHQVFL